MKKQLIFTGVICLLFLWIFGCGGDNGVTPPPTNQLRINSITPSVLSMGARLVKLMISGSGFVPGITVDLGTGIEILSAQVVDPQTIEVSVNVSRNALSGPRIVTVTTAGMSATMESGLSVADNKAPLASFAIDPEIGTINSIFTIDAGASTDEDGTITGYKWEISDGTTPKGVRVKKQFENKGSYQIRLTVTDNQGGISSVETTLKVGDNLPPVASFNLDPTSGTINSIFTLDAGASSDEDGSIAGYKWEISDGTNLKGMKARKQFDAKGNYTVRLTVTDDKGSSDSIEKRLEVSDNEPPIASFIVDPKSGNNLTVFTFDASASGDPDGSIQSYRWTFGDQSKSGVRVTHKFEQAGEYQVELRVKDSGGAVAAAMKTVSVEFFDIEKAKHEISDVIIEFMKLFDKIEQLSAEQIVVGFSRDGDCQGRDREIRIIEGEKPLIKSAGVDFLGDPTVSSVNDKTARASITNRFYGVMIDGTDYSDVFTHNFTMVNENGVWLICDFTVTQGKTVIQDARKLFGH